MSNVLEFHATRSKRREQVYRVSVSGIEPGQRVLLWQDRYQRFWLEVSKAGQINFRMEPFRHVS